MLLSKMPFWPGGIVNTRVPVSTVVAPVGSAGTAGIGGSDPTGLTEALGDALGGGVAVADAVAAGVTVGRTLVDPALVDGVGAGLRDADADAPGKFRSVSAPQALSVTASTSMVASQRLRG